MPATSLLMFLLCLVMLLYDYSGGGVGVGVNDASALAGALSSTLRYFTAPVDDDASTIGSQSSTRFRHTRFRYARFSEHNIS